MTASCPECDASITLAEGTVEGEIITCPIAPPNWKW